MIEPPCPRCGGDEARHVLTGTDHLHLLSIRAEVAECSSCGLWYQRPRLPLAQHGALYPTDYAPHGRSAGALRLHPATRSYLARRRGYLHLAGQAAGRSLDRRSLVASLIPEWLLRWRVGVALIPAYVHGGRVLDVGSGSGVKLNLLRLLGWEHLYAIELDPDAAQLARATGAQVRTGSIEEALGEYPREYFDVIMASMVLEHVGDPYAMIRECARKLRPGGELLLSTVSRDSLDAALFGEYWAGFDFPRHMIYPRKQDIIAMVSSDFASIEWFPQLAPIDWLRSASWRGRPSDRLLVKLGPKAAWLASVVSALAGRTTRLSLRCRREDWIDG